MNIITRALYLADAAVALAKVSTTRADDIKLYDKALTVLREALTEQALQNLSDFHQHIEATEPKCSEHPDAPHGFDRNASHNAGRYVCECEGWEPDEPVKQEPVAWKRESDGSLFSFEVCEGLTPLYAAPVSVEAAVLAEREACAKVCDDKHDYMCSRAAAAIRARG